MPLGMPERDEPKCGVKSRSNWPVYHYDGRWECSQPPGHLENGTPHLAVENHDWDERRVAWIHPWVDTPGT